MPVLGLSSHKDSCVESYKDAICKAGYRYIAISPDSGTEKAVEDALALSLDQIDRKDMALFCKGQPRSMLSLNTRRVPIQSSATM